MANQQNRMETLKANGIDTTKFFNLNMDIPVGASVQITIDGVPYKINSSSDSIVRQIMDSGYVFNSRVDGRFVTAQTFKMLNERSYNFNTRQYEYGWDAYLRNAYPYMYQFDMMLDEVHKLAKMQKSGDKDFDRLSNFFTKDVVYETCKQYIRQLEKFIKKQRSRKCNGKPYVKLNKYGNIFLADLNTRVYQRLNGYLLAIKMSSNYDMLENNLKLFMNVMCKLPYETSKCSQWKDAFKGKGAYVTLLNIVKFHGVRVVSYETGELLNRDDSVAYVESKLVDYKGQYWKFHELLKATIAANNFDLKTSIQSQK